MDYVKKILQNKKWFAIPIIFNLVLGIFALVIIGFYKFFYLVYDLFKLFVSGKEKDMSIISAKFIFIIDIYLLAFVFYVFSIGVYKIFVAVFNEESGSRIKAINNLKLEIASLLIIFLCTFFVQKVVEMDNAVDLLYLATSVGVICSSLIFYYYILKKHMD